HIVEAQAREAGVEGLEGAVVSLVVVPQLRGHEELRPRDAARADGGPDVRLVAIDARGVHVPVPEAQRLGDGPAGRLPAWGLVHAEAEARQLGAAAQANRGRHGAALVLAHGGILERNRTKDVAASSRRTGSLARWVTPLQDRTPPRLDRSKLLQGRF